MRKLEEECLNIKAIVRYITREHLYVSDKNAHTFSVKLLFIISFISYRVFAKLYYTIDAATVSRTSFMLNPEFKPGPKPDKGIRLGTWFKFRGVLLD